MTEGCFHCDQPLPAPPWPSVRWNGVDRPVCCPGCAAVATLIIGSGQGDYYRFRDSTAAKVDPTRLERLDDWEAFDRGWKPGTASNRLELTVGGMHCAACGWLIEKQLRALPGIGAVEVDVGGGEVTVELADRSALPSQVLKRLVRLGFSPHLRAGEDSRALQRRERSAALRRLAVAGLGMMQVMMYAVGTYFGEGSMTPALQRYLEIVSMLIATPILLYAGAPFFVGAFRALAARALTMEVPVALALALAWGASCRNLLWGSGPVYFDSISMFVFFLLAGRFIEMSLRHRAAGLAQSLAELLPETAMRLEAGVPVAVPRARLEPGDSVLVRRGETVPADGRITAGVAEVDESLLTGEPLPRRRVAGERVLAGSINHGGAVTVEVVAGDERTWLARLGTGLRPGGSRPRFARLADRIAGVVVLAVLLLAGAVYLAWSLAGSSDAFQYALAVLVVTCPCALSLATPVALSAATAALARRGILVSDGGALLALARIDRALFDKTGTLTLGAPRVAAVEPVANHPAPLGRAKLLAVAAALERFSAHPLAAAFASIEAPTAQQVTETEGQGVSGRVGDRGYRLGRPGFAGAAAGPPGEGSLVLADAGGVLGSIRLEDTPREDGRAAIAALARRGIEAEILSGDARAPVAGLAAALGIRRWRARQTPAAKRRRVRSLQRRGCRVLAIGDGVNDGPQLEAADVSMALAGGASLAQSRAQLVLTGERLMPLIETVDTARRTRRIITQNLVWAALYNLAAVPAAALGLIVPWVAVLGMSLSSLIVVLNSTRILGLIRDGRRSLRAFGRRPVLDASAARRAEESAA